MADQYEFDENGIPSRVSKSEQDKRNADAERERKLMEAARKRRKARVAGDVKRPQAAKTSKKTIVNDETTGANQASYHEKLPNGGTITLLNPEEVSYFRNLRSLYEEEYASLLSKPNDLNRLSQLISFELIAHRNTQRMMGAVNVYDDKGNISGIEKVDPVEVQNISQTLPRIQDEIRKLEQALKIDKRTREGSNEADIKVYMETLKNAAINWKVHLSKRYTEYDNFVNELRWRMRVFLNHDDEDRAYHDLDTPEKLTAWIDEQLKVLEQLDKEFAKDVQSLWVGRV